MFKIYQIVSGDTLESISKNLGINVDELKRINGIIGNPVLIPGTSLIVPNRQEVAYISYTVKPGDTIYEIAKKHDVDYKTLLLINGLEEGDYIYPNQLLLVPNENIKLYVTEKGDTLTTISEKTKIPVSEIIDINDTIFISPEQVIIYKKEKK